MEHLNEYGSVFVEVRRQHRALTFYQDLDPNYARDPCRCGHDEEALHIEEDPTNPIFGPCWLIVLRCRRCLGARYKRTRFPRIVGLLRHIDVLEHPHSQERYR